MSSFNYKHDDLLNPCLQAVHNLGGSGTISEIEDEVIKILNLSDKEINDIHNGNVTKFSYRLAWTRTYLKFGGFLDNPRQGLWALTDKGQKTKSTDKQEIGKEYLKLHPRKNTSTKNISLENESFDTADLERKHAEEEAEAKWRAELSSILTEMDPGAFERLSQRFLRELGFENVEVTGRSNDGGIDGKGRLRVGSVVTFSIVFQCKRYKGSVSSSTIRDFRGALQGRAEKGLVITTGRFTREAKREAQRDGAIPIDLIDGNDLMGMLKKYKLGVKVEKRVSIDADWFLNR